MNFLTTESEGKERRRELNAVRYKTIMRTCAGGGQGFTGRGSSRKKGDCEELSLLGFFAFE